MMDEIDEILDKAPFYIEQVGIRQVREKVYYSESAINSPKAAVDILAEEWGVDVADITKSGGRSGVIVGLVKDRV